MTILSTQLWYRKHLTMRRSHDLALIQHRIRLDEFIIDEGSNDSAINWAKCINFQHLFNAVTELHEPPTCPTNSLIWIGEFMLSSGYPTMQLIVRKEIGYFFLILKWSLSQYLATKGFYFRFNRWRCFSGKSQQLGHQQND